MGRNADDLPLRLARGILWAAFGILFCIRVASGLDNGAGALGVLLPMASYPPLVALVVWRWSPAVRYGLLAAVVLLYCVPFLVVGELWDWVPWTLAAAVLCALPARFAWPLFVFIVAASGVGVLAFGYDLYPGYEGQVSVGYMIITADDGLILFGLSALVRAVEQLHGTREELARMALARERLRLDGELRDLLGGKLQVIAFRMRKAGQEGAQDARRDIQEGVALARRTLAEVRAMAGAYRADPPARMPPPIESIRLARRVLLAVLVVQCVLVVKLLAYLYPADWPALGFATALLAVIVILQMLPQSRAVLLAQSLLIVAPLAIFPDAWDRLLGILTGKLLLNLRPPRSWAVVGVVLAGHLTWFLYSIDGSAFVIDDLAAALSNFGGHIMIMWLVYCLGRLSGLATILERAQHELAEAAVRRERVRIAGDLHDVLGFSLSAVALKGEVAERLLHTDPARAGAETGALVSLVERALEELRSIADDAVELRLTAELDAAREVLGAAGIEVVAQCRTGSLPPEADTAVAAALRETVTNVLRHSQARRCEITVAGTEELVRLRVVNDGALSLARAEPATPSRPERHGSGLGSIARRTGGRLTAVRHPGGRFEVIAEFSVIRRGTPGVDGSAGKLTSDPAGLGGDPDGVHPIAGPQLGDG
ncbi:sensor histidine kinase [Nonomuraea insulae]|uniref:Sensor histidine kinase n=1 Tax=Nonomuraea insulae TaxID=1616787 RepID=A0ABW1CHZ1_9ACTN